MPVTSTNDDSADHAVHSSRPKRHELLTHFWLIVSIGTRSDIVIENDTFCPLPTPQNINVAPK